METSTNAAPLTIRNSREFHQLLEVEPMKAIERLQSSFERQEKGYRHSLHEYILCAYEFAVKAKSEPEVFDDFLKHADFVKVNCNKPLLAVMRYLLRDSEGGGPLYERARTYENALRQFFDNGETTDSVRGHLKSKGIEALYDEAKKRKASGKTRDADAEPSQDEMQSSSSSHTTLSDNELQDDRAATVVEHARSAFELRDKQHGEVLHLNASLEHLCQVCEIPFDELTYLGLVRKHAPTPFSHIVVVEVRPPGKPYA